MEEEGQGMNQVPTEQCFSTAGTWRPWETKNLSEITMILITLNYKAITGTTGHKTKIYLDKRQKIQFTGNWTWKGWEPLF
jgi:hypothetical protein